MGDPWFMGPMRTFSQESNPALWEYVGVNTLRAWPPTREALNPIGCKQVFFIFFYCFFSGVLVGDGFLSLTEFLCSY